MKIAFYISLLFFIVSCSKLDIKRVSKITTDEAEISNTAVSLSGTVIDLSSSSGIAYGHCWNTSGAPSLADAHTEFLNAESGISYTSILDDLEYNTTYYVRAYTRGESDTTYGEVKTIIISSTDGIQLNLTNLTILSESELEVNAEFSGMGSLKANNHGICWSNTVSPTIDDNYLSYEELNEDTSLTIGLNSLIQDTNYYFRAFLDLGDGVLLYSNELNILISDLKVITGNHNTGTNSVVVEGEIISLGVLPVTDHGHCWSYNTSNPSLNDNVLSIGANATIGTFENSIPLIQDQGNVITYYYRAYAVKENQIVYGEIKSFTP